MQPLAYSAHAPCHIPRLAAPELPPPRSPPSAPPAAAHPASPRWRRRRCRVPALSPSPGKSLQIPAGWVPSAPASRGAPPLLPPPPPSVPRCGERGARRLCTALPCFALHCFALPCFALDCPALLPGPERVQPRGCEHRSCCGRSRLCARLDVRAHTWLCALAGCFSSSREVFLLSLPGLLA